MFWKITYLYLTMRDKTTNFAFHRLLLFEKHFLPLNNKCPEKYKTHIVEHGCSATKKEENCQYRRLWWWFRAFQRITDMIVVFQLFLYIGKIWSDFHHIRIIDPVKSYIRYCSDTTYLKTHMPSKNFMIVKKYFLLK